MSPRGALRLVVVLVAMAASAVILFKPVALAWSRYRRALAIPEEHRALTYNRCHGLTRFTT